MGDGWWCLFRDVKEGDYDCGKLEMSGGGDGGGALEGGGRRGVEVVEMKEEVEI